MNIYKFTTGNFAVNCYLVHPLDSSETLLIDSGEDPEPILEKIEREKLHLRYLINTHGHADHIAGNRIVLEKTGAELLIHEMDAPFLSEPELNLSAFFGVPVVSPHASRHLMEGDVVNLGELRFHILHTPGHTPGHITLVRGNHAFVGDVIFQGSIGRTDFPRSSSMQLLQSIRSKIYSLPDQTVLYPGHGPNTRVDQEKSSNPFVSF